MDKKMNPAVKKLWIEELRSGKYKYGRAQLKCGNKYCALGVLFTLCPIKDTQFDSRGFIFDCCDDEREGLTSKRVADWCGLDQPLQELVWNVNDREKATFEDVAAWVEENL